MSKKSRLEAQRISDEAIMASDEFQKAAMSSKLNWLRAGVLGAKGIPNRVDDWGPGVDHDWPTWRTMLPLFLDRLLPA